MKAGTAGSHGDDYADAHLRHWTDAELLYAEKHWPNADYLYGLSAECGLKAVMRHWKCRPKPGKCRPKPGKRWGHLPELWPTFETFAQGRNDGRYLQLLPVGEPFADWSIHGRYANRKHFDQGRVGPHRDAARGIRVMVDSMELEQDGDNERILRCFR